MIGVEQGRLSLDRPVCRDLPSCPAAWQAITLRHLLSHTSGLVDRFGDLEAVPVDETAAELHRVLGTLSAGEELRFAPGSQYAYTNFNYVLVGVMLEVAFGEPWQEVIRQTVAGPLALTSVRYDDVYALVPDRVRGYDRDDDGMLRNIQYDDHAAYAVGGLLANAGDLLRWSRAVLRGELFGDSLVQESLTPVQSNYGYGWQVREFFGRAVYNHTGGIDGFSSHLAHYPGEGTTIVVLTNVEADSAILTACDAAGLAFGWHALEDLATGPELTGQERCGVGR
jgi:CubicO group peptidase (beta-lactamase class C family)